ncbi:hypothetical protein BDY24DRAFT_232977 [Mrakia frigida]|uniref:uncharacterized protein n=1 Tax=Mrakia frigida TaxID=29902 RepID=UPI003FCC10D0
MPARLEYHKVTSEDAEELIAMRRACGWGEDRIPRMIAGEDMIIYLFYLPSEDGISPGEPVGMGGYELVEVKHGGDLELCNRLTNTIMLGSLFIYQKFEGKGYGNVIMDILEGPIAVELGAQTITLDTLTEDCETGEESRPLAWYLRRGYTEFRPRRPFVHDRYRTIAFLSKKVPPLQVD